MVLGMFGKALSPVPKPCIFLAEVARGIITLILTADLVTSSEGNGRGGRVPEPCGQGAVGSRLSFGRSPVCPSCQWLVGRKQKSPLDKNQQEFPCAH